MRTYLDCIVCFVRQSVEAARALGIEEDAAGDLLRRVLGLAQQLDWRLPPPVMGRDIHRAIREILNNPDPYLGAKMEATEKALEMLPAARARVAAAADPFLEAVRISIAGNIIDLGAKTGREVEIEDVLDGAVSAEIDEGAVTRLKRAVEAAGKVLFICDNAGEIVFDRPLLERLGEGLTLAVRGSPAINDATMEDAERSGVTGCFRVITSGADTPGTWLPDCSDEFRREFEEADVVVAKGQGNYETLGDSPVHVFFLLRAKCPVIAADLEVPVGTFVLKEQVRTSVKKEV